MGLDDDAKRGKAAPPQPEGGARAALFAEDDFSCDIEFDLIDEESDGEDTVNDVFARDTAIPAPAAHLSAETIRPFDDEEETTEITAPMAGPPRDNPRLPPPPVLHTPEPRSTTIEPPSEDLEFDSFAPPVDVFGQPLPGVPAIQENPLPTFGRSEMPTAPPAAARELLEQTKRSLPAKPRPRRPAFLAETARNPPADAEMLVRATLPGKSNAQGRAVHGSPAEGHNDSALDFVDGLDPLLDSLAPMSGLEAASPRSAAPRAGPREMQECYAVGDFSRALSIAEDILARSPDDSAARRCAQNCREVLTQMFAARIGPLDQVISVNVSPDEVQWLALDHRAGFLLSLVDGQSTVDEILDISGMTRLDALKIIFDLTERQVVRLS